MMGTRRSGRSGRRHVREDRSRHSRIARSPFDLFTIYIGGTDVAQHRFWRYAFPNSSPTRRMKSQIEKFSAGSSEDTYRYVDRTIGEYLSLAPPDAAVMIVSDHGMHKSNTEHVFKKDDPPLQTTSAHHPTPSGVIIVAGGPFVSAARTAASLKSINLNTLLPLGRVIDVAPTVLAVKGVPIGEDMDGHPAQRSFST